MSRRTTFEGIRCNGCGLQGGINVEETQKHGWLVTDKNTRHELFLADAWCPDCVSFHLRKRQEESKTKKR